MQKNLFPSAFVGSSMNDFSMFWFNENLGLSMIFFSHGFDIVELYQLDASPSNRQLKFVGDMLHVLSQRHIFVVVSLGIFPINMRS